MKVRAAATRVGTRAVTLFALIAVSPLPARALTLFDQKLSLEDRTQADLTVALAQDVTTSPAVSLDFDLLGTPPVVTPPGNDASLKLRRSMLGLHQGLGLGLLGLQLATTVAGQLNYSDQFGANPPATARYEQTHKMLAYSTLAAFAVTGAVAIFAPGAPGKQGEGLDRVTLHKIGMATAAAGMIAQGVLGIYTHQQVGYLDQSSYAQAHLIIGYVTLAAVSLAVGALVF